jgi:hypothetical protein
MDYPTYVTTLANGLVLPQTDTNYLQFLPAIISDASQRIRRDLDLLSDVVRDQTGTLTPNSRNFTFPQHFVVSESINVFSPAGNTTNRTQLVPVTREWLDYVWGNETAPTTPSVPQYYAMITDQTIIVGPPPDASYTMEVIGTIIPPDLSASQTTTWISLYLPDLFLAASLAFGVGYLKDYGAATDDPNAAGSWSNHYDKLLIGANNEETRKKYASQAWTSKQPSQISTPPRV